MRELLHTLIDSLRCGDLVQHLAAWWRVVSGRVSPEDRIAPSEPKKSQRG